MRLSYDAWPQVYQCFHPDGGGGGITPGHWTILKNLGSNSPPTWHIFVSVLKSPGHAFKFRPDCFNIF